MNVHHQRLESFVHASHGADVNHGRNKSSDKENRLSGNHRIEDAVGMQCIQESQMEDRSFRKR